MRLYLVRHGETILNQKKCYYGDSDVPLSERGVRQAQALGKELKDITFDTILSSPLRRAVDTAKRLCRAGEKEEILITDDRLKEQQFGIFEEMTVGEVCERYPKEWDDWNQDFANYVIPKGESFRQVRERVDCFLAECQEKYKGTVLITAHKGTLGHMLASMLQMPLEGYWNFVFEQGCYNIVDLEDGYAIIRGLNIPAGEKEDGFI